MNNNHKNYDTGCNFDTFILPQAQIAKQLIITYGVDATEIAALTPYSAQREEIRKELRNYRVGEVRVKTITDSQGTFSQSINLCK